MFSEGKIARGGEGRGVDRQEASRREVANRQRQQRKLTAIFLTGNLNYLNEADAEVSRKQEEAVMEQMRQGEIGDYQARDVISNIALPEGARARYDGFLRNFPTPFHFEKEREKILAQAEPKNREAKEAQLEAFSKEVYGKRWEYYQTYLEMKTRAGERREKQGRGGRVREAFLKRGEEFLRRREVSREKALRERLPKQGEREVSRELVKGVGVYDLSKGFLRGERNPAPSEDAYYVNEKTGTFAVFDGAGGERGGREASQAAYERIKEFIEGNPREQLHPETENRMIIMLGEINRAVMNEKEAGYSTGVIAQIVENQGRKQMIYGAVGDSRIYVVRGSLARQVTDDEGHGRVLDNYFGDESCRIRQVGRFDLIKGDKVILCSDGITGDVGRELLSEDEVAQLANKSSHPQQIARDLVEGARKLDDRTAVVVEI